MDAQVFEHIHKMTPEKIKLKKGEVIMHAGSSKKGIVIDWGIYHSKYDRYMLAKKEEAELIRVWTSDAIEIWPINNILPIY